MELDTSWITNFENLENEYNIFYKDKVTEISIFSIYIDGNHDILKIKKEKSNNIINNTINKNHLLYLIKNNINYNNVKYKLISILKFNIDINTLDINNFLYGETPPVPPNEKKEHVSEEEEAHEEESYFQNLTYLSTIKNLNDIHFNNTINIFQDINALFFIYYSPIIPNQNSHPKNTKKVYIKTNKHRKTKRK